MKRIYNNNAAASAEILNNRVILFDKMATSYNVICFNTYINRILVIACYCSIIEDVCVLFAFERLENLNFYLALRNFFEEIRRICL